MKELLFLISVVLFFAVCSCNKGREIEGFYLTEEMKSQLPFKGFETIRFVDESGKMFMLSGDGKITTFIKVPDCINCVDYNVYEKEWIKFSDELFEIELKLSASIENYLSVKYTVDGVRFWCGFISPLSEENLEEHEIIFDSIIINNVSYYDVYRDTVISDGTAPLITPFPVFFYYSIEYGLLKIDFSDKTYWELESIEW